MEMSIKHAGYTFEQAAAELGVSEDRVRLFIADGTLRIIKSGRASLVDLPDSFLLSPAARLMGITHSWTRNLIRRGDIQGVKLGERAWLIELREIRRFNLSPPSGRGRPRLSDSE